MSTSSASQDSFFTLLYPILWLREAELYFPIFPQDISPFWLPSSSFNYPSVPSVREAETQLPVFLNSSPKPTVASAGSLPKIHISWLPSRRSISISGIGVQESACLTSFPGQFFLTGGLKTRILDYGNLTLLMGIWAVPYTVLNFFLSSKNENSEILSLTDCTLLNFYFYF